MSDRLTADQNQIIAALAALIGCSVTGGPARRVAALVDRHGAPAVNAALPRVANYRKATGAVEALEAAVALAAPPATLWPPPPRCARCNDSGYLITADGWRTDEECPHGL